MVRGIWSTGSVTDSRTGTDVRFGGGESPRGREAGQWRGGFGQQTLSRTRGRERTVRFGWGRVHAGGRITLNLTCLRESMIDRGSSPREQAG